MGYAGTGRPSNIYGGNAQNMTNEFAHLNLTSAGWAKETVEKRLKFMELDHWFAFAHPEALLKRVEALIHQPSRQRPRNMLLTATTGMGKTALAEELLRRYPARMDMGNGAMRMPVLYCEMQPPAHPDAFVRDICGAAGLPTFNVHGKELRRYTREHLLALGPQLYLFDEVQLIVHENPKVAQNCCDTFKWIANFTKRPVVILCGPEAVSFFTQDAQLRHRFPQTAFPHWTVGPEFQSMVKTLLMHFPMREPWDKALLQEEALNFMIKESEGITMLIVDLLHSAAKRALQEGRERLTYEDVRAMG